METDTFARVLIVGGIALALAGGAVLLLSRVGFSGLPGDISFKRDGVSIYFPIVTTIVASIILTIVVNIAIRLFNR